MELDRNTEVPRLVATTEPRALKAFVAAALVIPFVFAIFWQTSASMISTWSRSETFAHGFLVVPAVLWFVWNSRHQLAATEASPWLPGIFLLIGAGFAWLLGSLADALAPAQWAMVTLVPLVILTLFGRGWLAVLAFPLVFLFFAVPFGEVFVPTLIDWTADFTVAALSATGIPVFREGAHFVIPSGHWSVVEACSGIRYLVASVMLGVLFAWTMYRTPRRRALFLAAAVVVPLIANWLRAYLIVMLGHLTNNRLAAGVDHLVYGWVFFSIVTASMFLLGARWREDGVRISSRAPGSVQATTNGATSQVVLMPPVAVLLATFLALGSWPFAYDAVLAAGDTRPIRPSQVAATSGWAEVNNAAGGWRPSLEGPVASRVQRFKRGDAVVTLFVGYYRDQKQGSELVNSMNRLVPDRGAQWEQVERGSTDASFGATEAKVRTATLKSGSCLRVWHWYWINGRIETGDVRAKLTLALDRLLLRTDTSAWIAISTESEREAGADEVLGAFARTMGSSIQAAMMETAAR